MTVYVGKVDIPYPFIKWNKVWKKHRIKVLSKIPFELAHVFSHFTIQRVTITFESTVQKREIIAEYKGEKISLESSQWLFDEKDPYYDYYSPWGLEEKDKWKHFKWHFKLNDEQIEIIEQLLNEFCPLYEDLDFFIVENKMTHLDIWEQTQLEKNRNRLFKKRNRKKNFKKIKDASD